MRRWLLSFTLLVLFAPSATGQLTCSAAPVIMNFGTYNGTSSTLGPTPMTITCLPLTSYTVALSPGVGAGATSTIRKMTGTGTSTLSYQLFQNPSYTTNFGNTAGIDTVAGTILLAPQTVNIYPRAAAGQRVPAGIYTDTVTASVTSALGTFTNTFPVTAIVPLTCTVAASPLNFGNYSGALIDASSVVTVDCMNLTPFNIGLSAGNATGATVTTRRMTSPASATLNYVLFQDSARTANWGNTVGTDTLSSQGNGAPVQYGVFGRMAAGQPGDPALYTDTIIATITY